ncbi:MAG: GTPase [Aureliella sp.]
MDYPAEDGCIIECDGSQAVVAARITPPIAAGIATIAIRGKRAAEIVLELAELKPKALRVGRIHFGRWPLNARPEIYAGTTGAEESDSSEAKNLFAEEVVVCRISEHQVEIHCHGGVAVCNAILDSLGSKGALLVTAEEFPTNDLRSLERLAEQQLIQATTDRVAAILLTQLNGVLRRELETVLRTLIESAESHEDVKQSIAGLIRSAEYGLKLMDGFSVVLAGPPNVGKSSLLNRLAGQTKSIVHEEAGTTRDWVEVRTVFDGWPVVLSDTAGVRDTEDQIEAMGVHFAEEQMRSADIVVAVVDSTEGWTETHDHIVQQATCPVIVCWNKVDLVDELQDLPSGIAGAAKWPQIRTSCSKLEDVNSSAIQDGPASMDELMAAVMQLLPYPSDFDVPCVFHPWILNHLHLIRDDLHAGKTSEAITKLNELLD